MRFSDTTRKIVVKMFFEGVSISILASSYGTTPDVIERLIRTQLREDNGNK
jgi:transposase-like protein